MTVVGQLAHKNNVMISKVLLM